jgi:hypothetical protein
LITHRKCHGFTKILLPAGSYQGLIHRPKTSEFAAMKIAIYQWLHVGAMVLLTAFIFQTFANPDPKNKRRTGIITGILALVALIGGFGLLTVMKTGFPWWIIVKLVCWFGLVAISGLAYRKPERIPVLTAVAIVLVLTAVATVYFRHALAGSFE